jgi:hypothetical protein
MGCVDLKNMQMNKKTCRPFIHHALLTSGLASRLLGDYRELKFAKSTNPGRQGLFTIHLADYGPSVTALSGKGEGRYCLQVPEERKRSRKTRD